MPRKSGEPFIYELIYELASEGFRGTAKEWTQELGFKDIRQFQGNVCYTRKKYNLPLYEIGGIWQIWDDPIRLKGLVRKRLGEIQAHLELGIPILLDADKEASASLPEEARIEREREIIELEDTLRLISTLVRRLVSRRQQPT